MIDILKNLYELRCKIESISEQLEALKCRMYSPKIQQLTGMPSGGQCNTGINEVHIELKQKLTESLVALQNEQKMIFEAVQEILRTNNISESDIEMVNLRFINGYRWAECAPKLEQKYTEEKCDKYKCLYK